MHTYLKCDGLFQYCASLFTKIWVVDINLIFLLHDQRNGDSSRTKYIVCLLFTKSEFFFFGKGMVCCVQESKGIDAVNFLNFLNNNSSFLMYKLACFNSVFILVRNRDAIVFIFWEAIASGGLLRQWSLYEAQEQL